jgi:hypothetical protein
MTSDTYSSTLGVLFMGTGNDNNTWGTNANAAVFQILEDAIANVLTSSVTGGTLDLSGSPPPAAASQVRFAALVFTGTLASAQTIRVPNLPKFWWVQNATSGAFALQIETYASSTAGTPQTIPQNSGWQLVYCDGAGDIVVFPFNSIQVQMPDGSKLLPSYAFINDSTSGLFLPSVTVTDGAMDGSTSALQCTTSNPFQPSDVGRRIVVAGAGAAGANLVTTIAAYTSPSEVSTTANSQTLVSGATVAYDGFKVGITAEGGTFGIIINPLGMKASTIGSIVAGGTNYAIGDTVVPTGGTALRNFLLTVESVSGGVVTGLTITDAGLYHAVPPNPVAQGSTSGSGSGLTVDITWVNANLLSAPTGTSLLPALGLSSFMQAFVILESAVAAGTALIAGGGFGALAAANTVTQPLLAPGAAPLPYVAAQINDNLHILNDATNATRDINVTPGRVRDDSDATNIQVAATMYKRLDTSWVAGGISGTPQGACDSGSKGTNQTWHVFAIGSLANSPATYSRSGSTVTLKFATTPPGGIGSTLRVIGIGAGFDGIYPVTGTGTDALTYTSGTSGTVNTTSVPAGTTADLFDILASQSYSSPTLPSGWTVKQCLGSILTDVADANIMQFTQVGDEFRLSVMVPTTASMSTTASLVTLAALPLGVKVYAELRIYFSPGAAGTQIGFMLQSPDETGVNAALTIPGTWQSIVQQASEFEAVERTNTSAQVLTSLSGTGGTVVTFAVKGWRDPRRRLF